METPPRPQKACVMDGFNFGLLVIALVLIVFNFVSDMKALNLRYQIKIQKSEAQCKLSEAQCKLFMAGADLLKVLAKHCTSPKKIIKEKNAPYRTHFRSR